MIPLTITALFPATAVGSAVSSQIAAAVRGLFGSQAVVPETVNFNVVFTNMNASILAANRTLLQAFKATVAHAVATHLGLNISPTNVAVTSSTPSSTVSIAIQIPSASSSSVNASAVQTAVGSSATLGLAVAASVQDGFHVVRMTVLGVDYSKLVADDNLRLDFEAAVKTSIIESATGIGLTARDIALALYPGSVLAEATIWAPIGSFNALFAQLSVSQTAIAQAAMTRMTSIPGINAVSTGAIVVPPVLTQAVDQLTSAFTGPVAVARISTAIVQGGAAAQPDLSAGSSQGLLSLITAKLRAQGLPEPLGLANASITGSGSVETVPSFVIPVPTWLTGAWASTCNSSCGSGLLNRQVVCTADNELACISTIFGSSGAPRPSAWQDCAAYTSCSFNALCPLGQGSSLQCGAQVGLFFGIGGMVLVLFTCITSLWCRRRCRAPTGGQIRLKQFRTEVSYKVQLPSKLPSKKSLQDSAPTSPDGNATTNKIHVVWDYDMEKVNEWFVVPAAAASNVIDTDVGPHLDGLQSTMENTEEFGAEVEDDSRVQSVSRIMRLVFPTSQTEPPGQVRPKAALDQPPVGPVHPTAYDNREKVEYYSKNHAKWLPGSVDVITMHDPDVENSLRVRYDVLLMGTNQKRMDVKIWDLRSPFIDNEAVDVWLPRVGGGMACVPGKICGHHRQSACTLGYKIQLVGKGSTDGPDNSRVKSGSLLRRRFCAGEVIQVYFGPIVGWQLRAVHPAAGADGTGVLPVNTDISREASAGSNLSEMSLEEDEAITMPPADPSPRPSLVTILPVHVPSGRSPPGSDNAGSGKANMEVAGSPAQSPHHGSIPPWVLVPLTSAPVAGAAGKDTQDVHPEKWVPSYLVRRGWHGF